MDMKTKILFVLLLIGFMSCRLSHVGGKVNSKWIGTWSETWGVGQKSDVDYHDIYHITKSKHGKPELTADKSEYRFIDVNFSRSDLTFKLINTTGNDTMPYVLHLDEGNDKITGYAYSIRKEKKNIEWDRVK